MMKEQTVSGVSIRWSEFESTMPNTSLHPTCITKAYNRTGLGLLPCPTGKLSPVPHWDHKHNFAASFLSNTTQRTCYIPVGVHGTKLLLKTCLVMHCRTIQELTAHLHIAVLPPSLRVLGKVSLLLFIKSEPGVAPMFFTTEQPVKS